MVLTPQSLRQSIAKGEHTGHTSGFCDGYLQCNVAMIPKQFAADFLSLCRLNPRPLPLVGVLPPGSPSLPPHLGSGPAPAPGTCCPPEDDIRLCIPKYQVFRAGEPMAECGSIAGVWREDLVTFLLGCSFSFEGALERAGVPVRNVSAGRNVSMYRSNVTLAPAGVFQGCPLVVSMRPTPESMVGTASAVTAALPAAHGPPVHVGDPALLGIADISKVDFGDPPVVEQGDVCIFHACGVTMMEALRTAKVPFFACHAPGHMLVTSMPINEARVLSDQELDEVRLKIM